MPVANGSGGDSGQESSVGALQVSWLIYLSECDKSPVSYQSTVFPVAFDVVCENLSSPSFEHAVGAHDSDIAFLSEFMNSALLQSLVRAHDTLEEPPRDPVGCDNIGLVREAMQEVQPLTGRSPNARELYALMSNPHFKALIEAHDDVAAKNYQWVPEMAPTFAPPPEIYSAPPTDAIRMVGVRKNPDEPLGITVKQEGEDLCIARILKGSAIERQGLLHVGDIIKEINGQEVTDPDQLQDIMKKCSGGITFKILPSAFDQHGSAQIFLKAHFNYDPKRDNLIPCREAGLPFLEGEILQIVNMDDNNWWQARKVDENGPSGLIPSQTLEEKRKAFVRPEYDYTHKSLLCGIVTKKKRKMMYQSKASGDFDRHEMMIYEEVARMPPFQRKTLVLVAAQGLGRRTLKQRLIKSDSSRFGAVVPHTSRPIREGEIDGEGYWYVSFEDMERDVHLGKFLEYGEFEGNYYGTKVDSIRRVVQSGRMCILDLNAQALKAIKTSEFMPYIVFIAAPPVEIMRNMHVLAQQQGKTDRMRTERDFRTTLEESQTIERNYKQFFDLTIVNDNMNETYNRLRKAIETLSTEPQWVPVSWVY